MSLELYHVGILVFDMDEAIRRYGDLFGVEFSETRAIRVGDDEPLLAFSKGAPPRYELIQATGDGLYARSQGEGLHHLGYWADDATAAADELAARGLTQGVSARTRKGEVVFAYFEPDGLHGVRIEIVDGRIAGPILADWLAA